MQNGACDFDAFFSAQVQMITQAEQFASAGLFASWLLHKMSVSADG